ncbi:pumilio-family RNA binding repeat protein [Phyllosticta capitalensis]|uniref:Pumilio-family RNA binding repeat protein n=1 Tax=Phyllosticta capitalensis TaxID=121624 RepID=A0ABR1YP18_9PEZI
MARSEDTGLGSSPPVLGYGTKRNSQMVNRTESPGPLSTSKLGNSHKPFKVAGGPSLAAKQNLTYRLKQMAKTSPSAGAYSDDATASFAMNTLLAKISEQQNTMGKPSKDMYAEEKSTTGTESTRSSPDTESTSAADDKPILTPMPSEPDQEQVSSLRKELEMANKRIALMDEELSQTKITNHTISQALGTSSEAAFDLRGDLAEQNDGKMQYTFNPAARIPAMARNETWPQGGEAAAGTNGAVPGAGYNRTRFPTPGIWGNGFKPTVPYPPVSTATNPHGYGMDPWGSSVNRQPFGSGFGPSAPAYVPGPQPQRYGPPMMRGAQPDSGFRGMNQPFNDISQNPMGRFNPPGRPGSAFGNRGDAWGAGFPYNPSVRVGRPAAQPYHTNMYGQPTPYPSQAPVGSRLSPTAAEFNLANSAASNGWTGAADPPVSTYISPNEPVNYRKLLDRNVNCNWEQIVSKIVQNDDQQASIFLQQKLKMGTGEQKFDIVESIIYQAYQLMVNRFGNFLVQRCFEHGTQEQIIAIAKAITGHVVELSKDAFGCHVIQKAFDAVPETFKAVMVHELLRDIPTTVVHRYACHVWQKLFELHWIEEPPQIMRYVNEALAGMWHQVALGETGSLVVQNIFENCLEEEKRPAIEEVLASMDLIAHGQFGNWCIQHICEHGAAPDRERAVDYILLNAVRFSMDQYASKVVEKCLKIGGAEFLDSYLAIVCEGRPDRPRIPLIDIAGDQFGNYLIQYIMANSGPQHRDIVNSHVRKHMVSLRGSKYGSRVAMLCCNTATYTRPGPPPGVQMNRHSSYGSGRGGFPAYH